MKLLFKPLILAAGLAALGTVAEANSLRFAESQDVASMDPHAARDELPVLWREVHTAVSGPDDRNNRAHTFVASRRM